MREKLQGLLQENQNSIAEHIILEALQCDNPTAFFRYILEHNARKNVASIATQSGRTQFYNRYQDEIKEIVTQLHRGGYEVKLKKSESKSNALTYMCYEHVATSIYIDIVLEEL